MRIDYLCGHHGYEKMTRAQADWRGAHYICSRCWFQAAPARQVTKNAAAAAWAQAHQLPALRGSEKQIAWAESLRRDDYNHVADDFATRVTVENFGDAVAGFAATLKDNPVDAVTWLVLADWLEEVSAIEGRETNAAVCRALGWILKQTEAKFWIDNRSDSLDAKIRGLLAAVREIEA